MMRSWARPAIAASALACKPVIYTGRHSAPWVRYLNALKSQKCILSSFTTCRPHPVGTSPRTFRASYTVFFMDLMGPFKSRSKHKIGAHWDSSHNAWRSNLTVVLPNGRATNMFLGYFAEVMDAASAYRECLVAYKEVCDQPDLTLERLAVMLHAIAVAQNARPKRTRTSTHSGVSWNKHGKYWKAQLYIKDDGRGRIIHGGNFDEEIAAAHAHKRAKLLWTQITGIHGQS